MTAPTLPTAFPSTPSPLRGVETLGQFGASQVGNARRETIFGALVSRHRRGSLWAKGGQFQVASDLFSRGVRRMPEVVHKLLPELDHMRAAIICIIGMGFWGHAGADSLLEGRVRLPSGVPVPGAQVLLFDLTDLRAAPVAATTDRSGGFTLPLARPGGGSPGALRTRGELSQPVQSLHDDSLPAAGSNAGAAGGVQHPRAAGGDPGGRPATGRLSHGELGRHRCGRGSRCGRGLSLPSQRRQGASHPVDGADRRAGGDFVERGAVAPAWKTRSARRKSRSTG